MRTAYDPDRLLWRHPEWLRNIYRPRVARIEAADLPSTERHFRHIPMILGIERYFHSDVGANAILDEITKSLQLCGQEWFDQRSFLLNFIKKFYRRADTTPAWVKIHPLRPSFESRILNKGGTVEQETKKVKKVLWAGQIGDKKLKLNEVDLSTKGLLLHVDREQAKPGQKGYALYEMLIKRTLSGDGLGELVRDFEAWYFFASNDPKDQEEMKRRGANLWGEKFRDDNKIQRSPLVSFCRMNASGSRVEHYVFSLSPFEGRIVDIRTTRYWAEYYFRSDMSSHELLEKLITDGCYDYF